MTLGLSVELELEHARRERDLYRGMLALGSAERLDSLLQETLDLIADVSGARMGYIELMDLQRPKVPHWSFSRACNAADVEQIKRSLSRGVIAEALASGRTVATASAIDDPRFRDQDSVQANSIEAVLCAPIGAPVPFGVIYLQDRQQPGPFNDEDRLRLESLCPYAAVLADRLIMRERESADATRQSRSTLAATGVIGRSAAIAEVLRQVSLLAPLEVTILLTGPTGTGKTQLARVIHANSTRAAHPFVEVNCGALPDTLIESELFGAVAGAHSTAVRRIEGKVGAANGGTLLLDEVGELTMSAQTRLLQLVQSKEYFPLGSGRAVHADVRVIAATHLDLKAAVAEKRFREDLFYRLNVVALKIPTLSDRIDDIPELLEYFSEKASVTHGLPRLRLSVEAIAAAQASEWPGNIRQLSHAVESAAIRAAGEGTRQIRRDHLFPDAPVAVVQRTFQEATRAFQAHLLRRTLEEKDWNVIETATSLDLGRSQVYNLIRAFGLGRLEEPSSQKR